MRILCVYDYNTVDGLLSMAIVRDWYLDKHGDESVITDLNFESKLNDHKDVLCVLQYTGKFPDEYQPQSYDQIILCGINPDDEYIRKMLELKNTRLVWLTNKVNKDSDTWLIAGTRDNKFPINSQLTWKYFFPDSDFELSENSVDAAATLYEYLVNENKSKLQK